MLDSRRQIDFGLDLKLGGGKAILERTLNIDFADLSCTSSLSHLVRSTRDLLMPHLSLAFGLGGFGLSLFGASMKVPYGHSSDLPVRVL